MGPEGIKRFSFSLRLLFFLFPRSEVSDWRSASACEWSEFSYSAVCLNILTTEGRRSGEIISGTVVWMFRFEPHALIIYIKTWIHTFTLTSYANVSILSGVLMCVLSCRCAVCVWSMCVFSVRALHSSSPRRPAGPGCLNWSCWKALDTDVTRPESFPGLSDHVPLFGRLFFVSLPSHPSPSNRLYLSQHRSSCQVSVSRSF